MSDETRTPTSLPPSERAEGERDVVRAICNAAQSYAARSPMVRRWKRTMTSAQATGPGKETPK